MLKQIHCPYCGLEMTMLTHGNQYECPHCGARGPDCNDEKEANTETHPKMGVYEVLSDAIRLLTKLGKMCDELMDDLCEADMIECSHCIAYENAYKEEECARADYNCERCGYHGCQCNDCKDNSHWVWKGMREHAETHL